MANSSQIGAIHVEVSLNSGKFVEGAKKVQAESKKTEAVVKSSFSSMGAAVKGFGGALTAGLSIGLLGGLAKKALDFAAAIGTTAKQLNVTTKELQEFRYAAGQVGIKNAEADKGLEKLGVTLGKAAAGSKTAQAALGAVGVKLADISSKTRVQIFGQIADQMIKQGGAAKNAAAANAVFGESASKLTPLLDKGSKGINQLSEAANRLGVVLSDQQIQSADETAQKLEDVRAVLSAQIAGVVSENATSIVSLANALASLTSSIVNFLGSNPGAALAILGGLAGARFGLPGAAAGALTGGYLGVKMGRASELANSDLKTRQAALKKARDEYAKAKSMGGRGGSMAASETRKRLLQEIEATERATSAYWASRGGQGAGTAAIPQFLAPAGAKPKKTRTPRAPRDRSDDVTFQFDQELRRAEMDVLRAQQGLARTSDERAAIAIQLLDAERAMQEAELNDRVRRAERDFAEGKITASALEQAKVQADKLRSEYADAEALQRKAIADELAADKARDAAELSDSAADLRIEQLQLESALADTAAEKRDVELRILAAMKEQEKARLEALAADQQAAPLARAQAQQRLDELDNIYAGREAVTRQGTRGPMEQWAADFGDIGEELEDLKVRGIMGAVDALAQLTNGWDSFADAAKNAISQVLMELIRLQLMKLAVGLISGGGGGMSTGVAASAGAIGAFNFASGGGFNVRGRGGIDKNLLSINGLPVANVSYGERISVSNDNGGSMRGGDNFHFSFPGITNAREARRSGLQAAHAFRAEVARSAKASG